MILPHVYMYIVYIHVAVSRELVVLEAMRH